MRLFYATYLSLEVMRAYQNLIDSLIKAVPGTLRSVPRQSHHLTLAFLGDIPDSDVEKCLSALDTLKGIEAFDYSLDLPVILMGRGRPRLIHVGLNTNVDRVSEIQNTLISSVTGAVPSLDTRSKPPHVTLARFQKNAKRPQARQVEQALGQVGNENLPAADRFSSIQLVKSDLTSSGPSYETLREIRL